MKRERILGKNYTYRWAMASLTFALLKRKQIEELMIVELCFDSFSFYGKKGKLIHTQIIHLN